MTNIKIIQIAVNEFGNRRPPVKTFKPVAKFLFMLKYDWQNQSSADISELFWQFGHLKKFSEVQK